MNGGIQQFTRILEGSVADSLRQSTAIFRERGEHFSADFTASMIEPAEQCPALYSDWARQQAERAAR